MQAWLAQLGRGKRLRYVDDQYVVVDPRNPLRSGIPVPTAEVEQAKDRAYIRPDGDAYVLSLRGQQEFVYARR